MTQKEKRLPIFLNKLAYIAHNSKESEEEKKAAQFYFDKLKNYGENVFSKNQPFHRGVGGTGDNIVVMPVVSRTDKKVDLDEKGKLQIIPCVFDDFKAYLTFIESGASVRRDTTLFRSIPSSVNGIPADEYVSIWYAHQGIQRD